MQWGTKQRLLAWQHLVQ